MLFFGKLSVFVTLNAVFVLSQNSKHWLGQISTIIPPWWDHNFCWNICALDYFWNIFRGVIIVFKKKTNKTQRQPTNQNSPQTHFPPFLIFMGKDSVYLTVFTCHIIVLSETQPLTFFCSVLISLVRSCWKCLKTHLDQGCIHVEYNLKSFSFFFF